MKTQNKYKSSRSGDYMETCLVSDHVSLTDSIKNRWEYNTLHIKDKLADIINDKECGLYIIDTAVNDMNIWPAPLLTNPEANMKLWFFLVSKLSDAARMEQLPSKAKFIERDKITAEDLINFIKKQMDPESMRKIEEVQYLKNIRSFMVRMGNSETYILSLKELPEADSTELVGYEVSKDQSYFSVVQKSGNRLEIPWDAVLYHCEPRYEHYKGKMADREREHIQSIGQKIRRFRIAKSYSIQELADKAGMKRPNLSRLEHGKHQPSLETLERIAEALEIPVAEILAIAK